MEKHRLMVVLKRLNEAHELMTSGQPEWSASDLRLLDAIDAAIETAVHTMAQNRALETAVRNVRR